MQAYIALGGNQGAVENTFRAALEDLHQMPGLEVIETSSFLRTLPMGENAGDPYLNAAAKLNAEIPALELLDVLQGVETRHGRKRETRWGPRTLDLDLLLFGDQVLNHPRLVLPHPGCWHRRFVLDPLMEIAPEVRHSVKGLTLRELHARLLPRPLPISISGGSLEDRTQFGNFLANQFPNIRITPWPSEAGEEPAILFWIGPTCDQEIVFEDLPLVPRFDLTTFSRNLFNAARDMLTATLG